MRIPPDPGSYVLVLRCNIGGGLKVGALGELRLEPGFYLYVGSALGPGGLRARLRHHWRHSARPHWHIDYLRARVELHEIWWSAASQRLEHAWAGALSRGRQLRIPLPGFGSSDCGCAAHLCFSEVKPSRVAFRRRLPPGLCGRLRVVRVEYEGAFAVT